MVGKLSLPRLAEIPGFTDKQKIAVLAHLELAVNSGNFEGVYLLSAEGKLVAKEQIPSLAMDFDALGASLLNAVKMFPDISEILLTYQDHRILIRPVRSMPMKGGEVSIPGVEFVTFILPITKTYRGNMTDLMRNLLMPFIKKEVKKSVKKQEEEETEKKRLAEQVLEDLDKI